jgi:hypothetical protein
LLLKVRHDALDLSSTRSLDGQSHRRIRLKGEASP